MGLCLDQPLLVVARQAFKFWLYPLRRGWVLYSWPHQPRCKKKESILKLQVWIRTNPTPVKPSQKVKEVSSLKEDPIFTKFFEVCLIFTTHLPISSCLYTSTKPHLQSDANAQNEGTRRRCPLINSKWQKGCPYSAHGPQEVLWKSAQARNKVTGPPLKDDPE